MDWDGDVVEGIQGEGRLVMLWVGRRRVGVVIAGCGVMAVVDE